MKITYLQAGEHRIPHLSIPPQPKLNKYALMRKTYLKEHKPSLYASLMLKGELSRHLEQEGKRAQMQVNLLMEKLSEQTPAPRPGDTLANTAHRNSLLAQAEEQVLKEIVYA